MRPLLTSSQREEWYASRYTGLFTALGPVTPRPHDPEVCIWSGEAALPDEDATPPASGGAGWDAASAEAAGVGEAIERAQAWPLPADGFIESSYRGWPLEEPAVAPQRFVLFHPEQHALPRFPYRAFDDAAACRWCCFRDALSGLPFWAPEELTYLSLPRDRRARYCPLISSGLSSGRLGQPVLLRGLQEVIERDAVVGAAWGRYVLEEHAQEAVWGELPPEGQPRLRRPNLSYRFYRVRTPFSAHVTVVTLEGEDREGFCFSTGAACRETRSESWLKSLLEAVQGRHYVRFLKERWQAKREALDVPASFADHALYYSVYPERLKETVLARAAPPEAADELRPEGLAELAARLGSDRQVLFRNLTPPGIAMERLDWCVLRVLVPGLQPLHGHHALPFLGGPLWASRGWKEWANMLPPPFA